MGALGEQMERDMVLRGMSPRTRESYLAAVAGVAKFYRRSPDQLDEAQVQQYVLHLMLERKLAWSSCNIAVSALKFFYHVTLKRPQAQFNIPRARAPQKLPQILSREEIARLIECTTDVRHRLILMLAYGAGLRVSELCPLKIADIDSSRMSIRVEQGKGAKDRYTLLSARLLVELRRYWSLYRPHHWLFPSPRGPARCIEVQTAQRVFRAALLRAGITKPCSIHSLRHAFATHLLEAKVDVHSILAADGARAHQLDAALLPLGRPPPELHCIAAGVAHHTRTRPELDEGAGASAGGGCGWSATGGAGRGGAPARC